jgi:putative FmdB family regulatory protein
MPLYEYFCPNCCKTFEALRPAAKADAAIHCPKCEGHAPQRILSLFAASVKRDGEAAPSAPGIGGGCGCGGACSCH